MFELIGLAIATLFLFLISCIFGFLFGFTAWLLIRNRECRRRPLILYAAAIPLIFAAYVWLCMAILPGESLFGDISQPLPNGYSLQALGKMPDFATINKGDSLSSGVVMLSECIGSLEVSGPLIAGRYSHPCDSFNSKPDEGYFIFNTQSGQFADFRTQTDLELRLGQPAHLVPTTSFRSIEPSYRHQQNINRAIMFIPPTLVIIGYVLWLLHFPLIKVE